LIRSSLEVRPPLRSTLVSRDCLLASDSIQTIHRTDPRSSPTRQLKLDARRQRCDMIQPPQGLGHSNHNGRAPEERNVPRCNAIIILDNRITISFTICVANYARGFPRAFPFPNRNVQLTNLLKCALTKTRPITPLDSVLMHLYQNEGL
jgi:hypothetical protein